MRYRWPSLPLRARATALATFTLAFAGVVAAPPASAHPSCGSTGVFSTSDGYSRCTYPTVGTDTFTVPIYQTSVIFELYGAGGGDCAGKGGKVLGTLAVDARDVFQTNTGGLPGSGSGLNCSGPDNIGGFNGGGTAGDGDDSISWLGFEPVIPGSGGAGASDVRVGAHALTDRIFVAGGGGGRSKIGVGPNTGGSGGGENGTAGTSGNGGSGGAPGGGGSQFAAGASPGSASSAGFGFGGKGGNGCQSCGGIYVYAGNGGGGGYYGGGGSPHDAEAPGSGGGGSGYITPLATGRDWTTGAWSSGNGRVAIAWPATVTASVSLSADKPNPVPSAEFVNLTTTVTTSTGAPPVGFVILVADGKYNVGSGFVDGDGTFTLHIRASSLPHATNNIVALFQDYYGVIANTRSSGIEVDRTRFNQTINFSSTAPSDATAGGASYSVAAAATSALPVTLSIPTVSSSICSISGSTVTFLAAGTCTINADQAGNDTYYPASAHQDVTVAWGSSPVPITATVSGVQTFGLTPHFIYKSNAPSGVTLSGTLDCSTVEPGTAITSSLPLGSYTIDGDSCDGLAADSDHYEVVYAGKTNGFVVTRPAVVVTPSGSQTYGGSPTFSYTSNAPDGVTVTGPLTCTTVGVGTLITPTLGGPHTYGLSGCSGLTASDGYSLTYAIGEFEVHAAVITVTVTGDQGYGGGPEFDFSDDSPVSVFAGVTCTGLTDDTAISPSLDVGAYTIDPSTCSGYTPPFGYTVQYESEVGAYLVNPVEVVVTVFGDQTYGGPPGFDYFASSAGRVTVSGTLSCDRAMVDTPIDETLRVGDYSVEGQSCHGLSLSDPRNFRLTYTGMANGGYRVHPRTITIAASGSVTQGGTPEFSYTDDAPAGVSVLGSLTCTAAKGYAAGLPYLAPGNYTLDGRFCSGLQQSDSTNYVLDYAGVQDDFVVLPGTINVHVSGAQTYGGSAHFSETDDAPSGVTLSGTLSCGTVDSGAHIGATLTAGNHTVDGSSCDGLSAAGYDVSYDGVTDGYVVSPATVNVQVSGSQAFGGSAHFTQTNAAPSGAGLGGSPTCTTAGTSTPIDSSLAVGSYTVKGSSCSGMTLGDGTNYRISYAGVADGYVVGKAGTSILYSGQQLVMTGSSLVPAATLSSTTACMGGQTVSFSLDANPLTGAATAYPLESATTNAGGLATGAAINTTGWLEGEYTITATFAATDSCLGSSYEAPLAVASPGAAASGGGWYSLSGAGRSNFGFTVRKVAKTTNTYTGQVLLINNAKWRIKGTLTSYGLTGTSSLTATKAGSASGTGSLYWWNAALNGGLGGWQLAKSPVSFTINFSASTAGKKGSPGSFGIQISYKPVAPQPSSLPNSTAQLLKGGSVNVS